MRRLSRIGVLLAIALLLFNLLCLSQAETPTGWAISDLQLISTVSKPDWGDHWSGPVEAATILAWFHDHGFPLLMKDWNGDGVIDELDTIELANFFGDGVMKTDSPRGTTDARLVRGLATYVAEVYPNEFELKIYDVGFPAEFAREFPVSFAPDAIPGILLALEPEPNYPAYIYELRSSEGVIIGIEEEGNELNYYLAGRSFLFKPTSKGYHPVDFAWGKEDRWEPGIQGQILETEAMETDALYIYYEGQWVKVEFMLALSPAIEHDKDTTIHGPCPEGAIGYDVTTTTTGYGEIEIEECVTRDGDVDTYTYDVRNISFVKDGCGICHFAIPNTDGLATIDQSGPGTWLINPTIPMGWEWRAPLGSCGIEIGESAVFSFSVPGPTTDVSIIGYISSCIGGSHPVDHLASGFRVRTTGPSKEPPDDNHPNGHPKCPDLTIHIDKSSCSCTLSQQEELVCTVDVRATVENIGNEPANHFYCKLDSAKGGDQILIASLAPGATKSLHFSFTYTVPRGQSPVCPLKLLAMADSKEYIDECIEANNFDSDSVCCD
jgi:hypothetical protein